MNDVWFVGRNGELALLETMVTALEAGVGGAVLVEGEQGIGKSALLRAGLAATAGEYRLLWGAADELGQRFPLRLMAECLAGGGSREPTQTTLRSYGTAGLFGPGLVGRVGIPAGDPVRGAMEGMLARVDRLCAVSPVVLVAEDLQWADEASLLLWNTLSQAVSQLPLLLAGSWRPGSGREEDLGRLRRGLTARGGNVITLGPLGKPEVSRLAGRLAGGRPGRRLERLMERAGGNPLYARELVDGLVRDGRVRAEQGVAELAENPERVRVRVPVSLAAAIGARLGSLPDDVLRVLRWAAMLGTEFSVTDLATVTGRSAGELMGTMEAGIAAGVLMETGSRLSFRHGLIRQVLYEGMPAALRAALHVQAAQSLAGGDAAADRVAAQLVHALEQDGWGPSPDRPLAPGRTGHALAPGPVQAWVAQWLASAAPVLIYRAPQVAAELLQRVVAQLAADDPRREELEASLVTVSFLLLADDEVARVGSRLVADARDPDRAAEMAWLVAYALARTGKFAEASAAVAQALRRPDVSDVWAARMRARQAATLTSAGDVDQAAETAAGALSAAQQAGDKFGAGYALHALATISFLRRDHDALLKYADWALELIGVDPRTFDLRLLLLANKTSALGDLDRRADALATGRQALVAAEQAGTPRLNMARCTVAGLYFEAGQWDDALAELEQLADLPGLGYVAVVTHGLSALIAAHRADWDAAQRHFHGVSTDLNRFFSSRVNAQYLGLARAVVAEREGREAEAMAILAQSLDDAVADMTPDRYLLMPMLTRLALAGRDTGLAAAAAGAAAAESQREPLRLKTAVADHCRGLLAGDLELVLAAASYYDLAGRPLGHAEGLEDAAMLTAAAGDLALARRRLTEAVRGYASLSARWDIRRAELRLRPYGVRSPRASSRAHPATGWNALTPTEAKVAGLVARGLSNADIAAELVLSRNTVQTHVSHILAKLAARSRAEIIRQVLRDRAATSG